MRKRIREIEPAVFIYLLAVILLCASPFIGLLIRRLWPLIMETFIDALESI